MYYILPPGSSLHHYWLLPLPFLAPPSTTPGSSLHHSWLLPPLLAPEIKHYYTQYMPYVSEQPHVRGDVLASLLEKNANSLAAQQEWETEWNQSGLASRLSEQVCQLAPIISMLHLPILPHSFLASFPSPLLPSLPHSSLPTPPSPSLSPPLPIGIPC